MYIAIGKHRWAAGESREQAIQELRRKCPQGHIRPYIIFFTDDEHAEITERETIQTAPGKEVQFLERVSKGVL